MTPPEHRARALELADRVYRGTSDYQALASVAVVHALLATGPTEQTADRGSVEKPPRMPLGDDPRAGDLMQPMSSGNSVTWQGWVILGLLIATVMGVVWLITQ